MPDLTGIRRNAIETQQGHKGFEPRIGRGHPVDYRAHCRSPGLVLVQACGCVKTGCWLDAGYSIGVPPWPSPAVTKLEAMN